jgi:hypothetical protein
MEYRYLFVTRTSVHPTVISKKSNKVPVIRVKILTVKKFVCVNFLFLMSWYRYVFEKLPCLPSKVPVRCRGPFDSVPVPFSLQHRKRSGLFFLISKVVPVAREESGQQVVKPFNACEKILKVTGTGISLTLVSFPCVYCISCKI